MSMKKTDATLISAALLALLVPGALVAPGAVSAQDVPVVSLGDAIATYGDGLGSLRGVRELPDGRVVIADGLGEALIVWSLGSGADTLTNVGEGPAEYQTPDGLFPLPGGGTLLVDLGNARLTWIDGDLAFGETSPIARGGMGSEMTMMLPVGTDDAGHIYFEQREGGMLGGQDSASIARFDAATEEIEVLGKVKLQETKRSESGGPNNRNVSVSPRPLTPQDAWNVGRDGRVAVARSGGEYRLEWIEPSGRVLRGTPVDYEPIKVRKAEKLEYLSNLGADGLSVMVTSDGGAPRINFSRGVGDSEVERGAENEYGWPDVEPPFPPNAVRVSRDGLAWVSRHQRAGEAPLYDVFAPDGHRLAQVRLPEGRQLVAFGDQTVYLMRSDELDFAWLERYDLPTSHFESARGR